MTYLFKKHTKKETKARIIINPFIGFTNQIGCDDGGGTMTSDDYRQAVDAALTKWESVTTGNAKADIAALIRMELKAYLDPAVSVDASVAQARADAEWIFRRPDADRLVQSRLEKENKMDWQPIETAPFGKRIFLYYHGCPFTGCNVQIGKWADDRHAAKPRPHWDIDQGYLWGKKALRAYFPTHWAEIKEPDELLMEE